MAIILLFFLLWTVLFILLRFTEVLTSGMLSRSLQKRNITLKFGYVSFYTTHFDNLIETFASSNRRFLSLWFSTGVIMGFVGLILSVALLCSNLIPVLTPPIQTVSRSFKEIPRIPFVRSQPNWFPRPLWHLFIASDHHPSSFIHYRGLSDMHAAAYRHKVRSYDPANNDGMPPRFRPFRPPPLRFRLPPHPRPRLPPCGGDFQKYEKEVGRVHSFIALRRKPFHRLRRLRRRRPTPLMRPRQNRRLLSVIDPSNAHTSTANESSSTVTAEHDDQKSEETINREVTNSQFLTPLIPGVTVPAGDVWYMLISVLIAGVVHELGHALAAGAASGGGVRGIGAFIALILPGAFVRLTGIDEMPAKQQLRVYCAGAWHNVVTAGIALGTVLFLPALCSPLFVTGGGAVVVNVPEVSPLYGHLSTGDVVFALGRFDVKNGGESFQNAVRDLVKGRESVGFCIEKADVHNDSIEAGGNCCGTDDEREDDGFQCFRVVDQSHAEVCLDAGVVASREMCGSSQDCHESSGRGGGVCVVPVMEGGKQLVDVHVESSQTGKREVLFYEGYGEILGQSVTVSSYVPRGRSWLPERVRWSLARADLPNGCERLLQYFASLSLGLAILNMAPVKFVDGEMCVGLFLGIILGLGERKKRRKLERWIVGVGSVLLVVNLVVGLWTRGS